MLFSTKKRIFLSCLAILSVGIIFYSFSSAYAEEQAGNWPPDGYCQMQLVKTADSQEVSPGETINYTISLDNTGTASCTGGGVKVRDYFDEQTLPDENNVTPEPNKKKNSYWEWNFGEVEPGEVNQINLTVSVSSEAECGSIITNKTCAWSKEYKKYGIKDSQLGKGWICTTVNTLVQCQTNGPECGNGIIEDGEQCDDGNNINGDGCSDSCQLEQVPLCPTPVDVMLILDRSASMSDDSYCQENPSLDQAECENQGFTWVVEPMNSVKTAAKYFVDLLDSSKDKAGLVSFATTASLDQSLTADFSLLKNAIDSLNPYGWTNIGQGIEFATDEMNNNHRPDAFPVMILLTDGVPNVNSEGGVNDEPGGAAYALAAANEAKEAGYTIYTIGLGSYTNPDLLKQLASDEDKYFSAPGPNDLSKIYNQIAFDICEYGSISGCKYSDLNNNGVIDNNEPTVDNWLIELSGDNLSQPLTATTINGCYQFFGLEAGTYVVKEGDNDGDYEQTYPLNPAEYTVALNWGEHIDGLDFANYFPICGNGIVDSEYGEECDDGNLTDGDGCSASCTLELSSIGGCKFNDLNNNGTIDEEEPRLTDWPITLIYPDQTEENITTGPDGCYLFTNLQPGTYQVREKQLDNWQQTYPASGSYTIELSYGQQSLNNDFANHFTEPNAPYCGDGNLDEGEECDAGSANGEACDPAYGESCSYCSNICTIVTLDGPYCGDGVKNGPEECDGQDGVSEGQSCSSECTLIEEPCTTNCGGGGGRPVMPHLVINKIANPTFTNPGGIVDYTIEVTNDGDYIGYDLIVTDTLPSKYLTYYSTSTNATSSSATWELGDIKAGETKTIKYQVLFATTTPPANYTNIATAEVSNGNKVEARATVEVRMPTVLGEEYYPFLALSKTTDMEFTNPGNAVTYTLTVSNTATDKTAVNVTVMDRLPDGFTFVDNNAGVDSWQLGDLAPGESKTITYKVKVDEKVKSGTYENLAVARADNAPEVFAKAPIEVRDVTVLGFELPDTNGGKTALLSLVFGIILMFAGYFIYRWKNYQPLI